MKKNLPALIAVFLVSCSCDEPQRHPSVGVGLDRCVAKCVRDFVNLVEEIHGEAINKFTELCEKDWKERKCCESHWSTNYVVDCRDYGKI